MKVMISGHRKSKLLNYDEYWIRRAINDVYKDYFDGVDKFIGLAGMADGVDLWFCEACLEWEQDFWAYIPFDGQDEYMDDWDKITRQELINNARQIKKVRNSQMVEDCDWGIVVWDGNKGGTHNVLQQLVEKKKPFLWINPVNETINYIK